MPTQPTNATNVILRGPRATSVDVGLASTRYTRSAQVPVVYEITPSTGPIAGGTTVYIRLDSSLNVTGATIGGVALTSLTTVDSTRISGVTGAHAVGACDVKVTNDIGTSLPLTGAFTYATFDPLSITGCVVWYDLAVCTNGGGVVSALPDQSGNARDATITGGSEPGYTGSAAAYNNKPVMSFSTTEIAVTPDLGLTTGARTLVIVCDIGALGADFQHCAFSDSVGDTWLAVFDTGINFTVTGDNNGTGNIQTGAGPGTPSVLVFVENGASSKLYASALTPATGTCAVEDWTGRTIQLGNYTASLDAAHSQVGSTAQFLVYNSALSQADCAYLLNGFGAKHAIPIGP